MSNVVQLKKSKQLKVNLTHYDVEYLESKYASLFIKKKYDTLLNREYDFHLLDDYRNVNDLVSISRDRMINFKTLKNFLLSQSQDRHRTVEYMTQYFLLRFNKFNSKEKKAFSKTLYDTKYSLYSQTISYNYLKNTISDSATEDYKMLTETKLSMIAECFKTLDSYLEQLNQIIDANKKQISFSKFVDRDIFATEY